MLIREPDFYRAFSCIAGLCPDSCCKEWDVAVDEEKAAFYRALPGALGDKLRKALMDEDGTTYLTLEQGRCPMWREDGLCRIQAELGEDALCKTCREFPRLTHDYGAFVEKGLELSCPEAAHLMLSQDRWNWIATGQPEESGEEADADMALLLQTRETAMALTQEEHPLSTLLLYGIYVQELLDGVEETPFDPAAIPDFPGNGNMDEFLQVFRNLEILTPGWKARLDAPKPRKLQREDRAMLRYLISRYHLQAISDFELAARMKMLTAEVLLVCLLGGSPVETAQLMSKEIENDAENVDALLDGAYTLPGLTDGNLLALFRQVEG